MLCLPVALLATVASGGGPGLRDPARPPLPWVQRGSAFVQVFEVPVATARACVRDSRFDIVETKTGSGVTQGSLYIAQYGAGSAVAYSEAIFICATVSYQGDSANWVSTIYVDSEVAKDAGIQVWGLPKQLASFNWTNVTTTKNDGPAAWPLGQVRVVVTSPAVGVGEVVSATFSEQPIAIPGMHRDTETFGVSVAPATRGAVLLSTTRQDYGLKLLPGAEITVPPASPLWNITHVAKQTTTIQMVDGKFNMTAPDPVPAGSRVTTVR